MSTLAVIPTYMTTAADVDVLMTCLRTLHETTKPGEVEVLVVDDGSPDPELVSAVARSAERQAFTLIPKDENEGFSRTVNVGLRQALREGRDAVLVNADVEFFEDRWLEHMVGQERSDGEGLASVVGGKLIFPNMLIQHGGIFFSLLHRVFEHWFKYAPHNLPEAKVARRVPVTGALQFIRHEAMEELGVYDEAFRLGSEDVDYCLRIFESGRECVYQPAVRALHHESLFRGRPSPRIQDWQEKSWLYLIEKWQGRANFVDWVPRLA